MPGMSGRELFQRLTGLRPEMRIIYMSGYTDSAAGLHDVIDAPFLQKPFTPNDLLGKVRELFTDLPTNA
jgi:FixJ family two-component response regulator